MINMQTSKGLVQSQNMTSLVESALVENPVPLNLHPPRKVDEFMRDMIFEKIVGSLEEVADSNLVKLQQKLLDVMRPLSKV